MHNILEVKNVNHKIGTRRILDDISFDVEANMIIGLLGPNGVGKSTLLRRIANLEDTSGTIAINGIVNDFTKFRTDVMLITSDIEIPWSMTLSDYCKLLTISFEINWSFVKDYTNKLGIDLNTPVRNLSKGNQEMAQLISCLATNCNLILLDEPFSAVDIYKRDIVLQMIIESKLNGKTIIITTHLIDELNNIIEKVLYIHDTKIEFYIDSEIIQSQSDSITNYLKERYLEE